MERNNMVVFCWSSILYKLAGVFAGGKTKKLDTESFSDDVIIDILSRLPADHVLECRRVCKRWLALTSTASFAELQLKRATPAIVAGFYDGNLQGFYVNDALSPRQQIIEQNCRLITSCDGLILGKRDSPSYDFIYNPITQDEITIPGQLKAGYMCGLYFHPATKEYRMLYAFDQNHLFQYVIVSLPTYSRRTLYNQFYCRPANPEAVLVSGNLHWMVEHIKGRNRLKTQEDNDPCANSILRFNIATENFDTMPHPECDSCPGPDCGSLQLFEVDGMISLCQRRSYSVHLWTCLDYPSWQWTRRYKFNLTHNLFSTRSLTDSTDCLLWIQNDELLLYSKRKGLFLYNLKLHSIRGVRLAGWKKHQKYNFFPYTKSLVSLRK
ncbi:hypothetical protein Tsubulata_020759 [Turnera subulata]|uniref:F-box domain-containing protein n=1 Tax=Turnera subulata TaxID=218843 RepID=A0A9Q0F1D1_9ROSI|nr:hypothetical protein Tsubulata_020759 [Turnera subulata]